MKANAAANYTANALNQYTERTVHGSSDIIGSAEQDVTITVNEEEANRQDYYPPSPLRCSGLWRTSWYYRLLVDNLFTPVYTQIVVEAIYDPGTNDPYVVSSETGSVFVAETPEVFTYDDDGNLLSDGRFDYAWDGENRLIAVTTSDGLPEDMPVVHVEFEYDYMSRRTGKTVYQWDAGITNWTFTESRIFVYDSWSPIQELVTDNGSQITNNYVWGLDLSGSLQGAGGIGGLLASIGGAGSPSTPVFYTYDANGNVSELINADGEILAHYEYSPFGETIVSTGPMAKENKFRFSTKYFDDETGLAYYGYRYYKPGLGRWINRDPIGERGHDAIKTRERKQRFLNKANFSISHVRRPRISVHADFRKIIDGTTDIGALLTALRQLRDRDRRLFILISQDDADNANLYSFTRNFTPNLIDPHGEFPLAFELLCLFVAGYGGYQIGSALDNFFQRFREASDAAENAADARQRVIDNPTSENISDYRMALDSAIQHAQETAVAGAQIPGTMPAGPPPTPPLSGADLVSDLLGIGLGNLND